MKIENTVVFGFVPALRGMRNPMNSWSKSDSQYDLVKFNVEYPEGIVIGPNDMTLCHTLIKGGTEHRKFLRMIQIWVDLTLPRYVWTEFDTYKVATVRNSCSTMHKLGSRDLADDDFEDQIVLPATLTEINFLGQEYRRNKNVDTLERLKQILPEAFLQKATINLNYETAMGMYRQRKNHRLKQWSGPDGICNWIKGLPYMAEFLAALEE